MATLYKYQTQGGQEVTFLDSEDQYQPEDIRQHWAQTFPELGSAQTDEQKKTQTVEVEGQQVEVNRVVTFAKKVGTKGAGDWLPADIAPPAYEFVLVAVEFPDAMPKVMVASYSPDVDHWTTTHGQLQGIVTHWMPLPALPETVNG